MESNIKPYLDWIDDQYDKLIQSLIEISNINANSLNLAGLEHRVILNKQGKIPIEIISD